MSVSARRTWTVRTVKAVCEHKTAIGIGFQRFTWGGRQLADDHTLESYGVNRESTVYVVLRVSGD